MLTFAFNILDFLFNTKFGVYFILIAVPFQTFALVWSAMCFRSRRD